jgi:hypothetical protein
MTIQFSTRKNGVNAMTPMNRFPVMRAFLCGEEISLSQGDLSVVKRFLCHRGFICGEEISLSQGIYLW